MKVLFVIESYHPNIGGLEKLFHSLAGELAKQDHQITVITNHPGGTLPAKEKMGNVEVLRYRFGNRYLFTLLAFFPTLIKAFSHDVIQTTSYNAAVPASIAGWLSGKKVIVTFHEYWGKLWLQLPFFSKVTLRLHQFFEWMLLRLPFYKFVSVSDYTAASLIDAGVKPDKVVRIYNGIDYLEWKRPEMGEASNSDTFRFIYYGRLGISKGLDILLNGAEMLRRTQVDFHLELVLSLNPAFLLDEIMQMIQDKGLQSHISISHHLSLDALQTLIVSCDAVVIPSYSEGFCYTAAESVALEMPIISSHRGALKEVVSGSYLQLEAFTAEGMADAMAKAMTGDWNHRPVRKFELDHTVDQYVELYQEVS